MGVMKHVPDLLQVDGKWRIEGFRPNAQAWDYDDHAGKTGIIYAIGLNGFHKIGLTRDFEKRLAQINSASPYTAEKVIAQKVPLAGMPYAESWIHKQLADRWIKNEWFSIDRETALAYVAKGKIAARLFAKECETWFYLEKARSRDPETAAKINRAYQDFLTRQSQRPVPQHAGDRDE